MFPPPPPGSIPELQPQTPEQELEQVAADLDAIVRENPGTPLADKVQDALSKMQSSLAKLRQMPPDRQGGLGELEGAVGDLEAAVKDGLLGFVDGTDLMNRSAGAARRLAVAAIEDAIERGGDLNKIAQAEADVAEGDANRAVGGFKDAVGKYRNALGTAEGA